MYIWQFTNDMALGRKECDMFKSPVHGVAELLGADLYKCWICWMLTCRIHSLATKQFLSVQIASATKCISASLRQVDQVDSQSSHGISPRSGFVHGRTTSSTEPFIPTAHKQKQPPCWIHCFKKMETRLTWLQTPETAEVFPCCFQNIWPRLFWNAQLFFGDCRQRTAKRAIHCLNQLTRSQPGRGKSTRMGFQLQLSPCTGNLCRSPDLQTKPCKWQTGLDWLKGFGLFAKVKSNKNWSDLNHLVLSKSILCFSACS